MERVEDKVSAEYRAWANQIYNREASEDQTQEEGASFFAKTVEELPDPYCKKFQENSDSALDYRNIYISGADFEFQELRYIHMLPGYLRSNEQMDVAVFGIEKDRDNKVTYGCLAISNRERIFSRGLLFTISNKTTSPPIICYPYGIDEKSAEEMKKLTKAEMLLAVNALARVYVERVNQ